MRVGRLVTALVALALALPAVASAAPEKKFNPSDEFILKDWVPIHLGPDRHVDQPGGRLPLARARC